MNDPQFLFDPTVSSAVSAASADASVTRASAADTTGPLSADQLQRMHLYWMAANYLTVGQIFLQDNPLLREPLRAEHIKPRLLGHWGTSPGLSLLYAHLNRVIVEQDVNMIYLAGPGHGGPALVATCISRGPTARSIPTSPATKPASGDCFDNSQPRAASPVT